MMKLAFLATTALSLSLSLGSAEARMRHHHHVYHHHYARPLRSGYPVTIGYGDTIISGKTGLHRSDFGTMVPDGTGSNFVLTGRRSGSGLGANGLPGSNVDE